MSCEVPNILYGPLIKEFSSESGMKYAYDCFSNKIFPHDQAKSACLYSPIYRLKLPFTNEELINGINDKLSHLILNVTHRCNLRCAYCSYCGGHKSRRKHSTKSMTLDVGKSAINWFNKHSYSSRELRISFYGGEPLLCFTKIKELVRYSQSLSWNSNIQYQINTNGTLITDEVVDWLIEHPNVVVNITVNGDKELHDRFRIYEPGKGSYEDIMERLILWNKRFPESFAKQSLITINYLNISDLFRIKVWYTKLLLFKNKLPLAIRRISLRTANKELEEKFKPFLCEDDGTLIKDLKHEYIDWLFTKDTNENFWRLLWEGALSNLYHRSANKMQMVSTYLGCCAPVIKKTFIDIDGTIHLCEKADGKCKLGSVFEGVNKDYLLQLVRDFENLINNKCHSCWALRRCHLCLGDVLLKGR